MKYLLIIACLLFLNSRIFAIDKQSFNLIQQPQSVPANWIRTKESGEVSETWYHCPTNNLEWRRVAPFYIETRPATVIPVRVPQMSFRPQLSSNC